MSEQYVEILVESRPISIDKTSANQSIVIQFQIDPDAEASYNRAEFLGASDDIAALEYAYSIFPAGRWIPGQLGNDIFLVASSIRLEQVNNFGWWKATVEYVYDLNTGEGGQRDEQNPSAPTLPFIKIGFSVGNRTKTITQSLEVLSKVGQIGPANRPNPCDDINGNIIGATQDNVTGAEVYASGLTLQITAYYFPQFVDFSFINLLATMFPSVNSDVFLSYSPGEVLLIGCDGSSTIGDIVPITFTAEIRKNVNNQPDPPFPTLTCDGHDFIDYRYEKELDECAQSLAQLPVHRIVHRVYNKRPFALLGFPTT
jgi:hypothetical protein